MKTAAFIIVLIFGLTGTQQMFAQQAVGDTTGVKELSSVEFKVYGNCNMCKNTIEGSLSDVDWITEANWNMETKMMQVTYDAEKHSLDEIVNKIAAVGYDTQYNKAPDAAYESLHGCCQYERKP